MVQYAAALVSGHEIKFLIGIALALVAGYVIGYGREAAGKDAGIRTHMFVVMGAMLFSMMATISEDYRIAGYIVSGVGFLGAGMIIKGHGDKVMNLTTAASIWFTAGVGMAIGFGLYLIAAIATLYAALVPVLIQGHIVDKK